MQTGRNCPCGSGKKYKKCCGKDTVIISRGSSNKKNQAQTDRYQKAYNEAHKQLRYCSWLDCGNTDVIKAHSISEQYLKPNAIDNHLLHFRSNQDNLRQSAAMTGPTRVGIHKATTFSGFCSKHDALFNPIDNGWEESDHHYFLHTYRIAMYNLYRAKLNLATQLAMHGKERLETVPAPPTIDPRLAKNMYDYFNYDIQANMIAKSIWDSIALSEDYDDIESYILYFDKTPELAVAMTFPCFHFFDGTRVNVSIGSTPETPQVHCMLFPFSDGGGVLLVTWHLNIRAYARAQWESFEQIGNKYKSDALLRMFCYMCGGTTLNIRWWNSLSHKRKYLTRFGKLYSQRQVDLCEIIHPMGRFRTKIVDWSPTISKFNLKP